MADISSLIANAAQTNADFNFGKITDAYWQRLENAYKQRARDAFQDPSLYGPGGQIDINKAQSAALKAGGLLGVQPTSTLFETGVLQGQYRNAEGLGQDLSGGRSRSIPPSPSRINSTPDQPDLTQGRRGPQAPQAVGGDQKGSLIGFLSANGVPDDGNEINILGGKLSAATGRRVDPNSPLDMNNPQVRGILSEYVRSRQPQRPQVAQAQQPQPQVVPQQQPPPQVAPQQQPQPQQPQVAPQQTGQPIVDPTYGGLVSPDLVARYGPNAGPILLQMLEKSLGSGLPPGIREARAAQAAALRSAMTPTEATKNALAVGMTPAEHERFKARTNEEKLSAATGRPVTEIIDRPEEAKAKQAILTGSTLPRLDKSAESANSMKSSIDALHRAREQLDAPGGIFSGAAADVRLKVAKVANYLGVQNTDKIANTEAFGSAIGERVLGLVRGLGAGAGISNADREYAAGMAGGNIKLNEASIRKILDIGEKAARSSINSHNSLVDRMTKDNEPLKDRALDYKVELPGEYKRPAAASVPKLVPGETTINGMTYKGGNPNDKKNWEQRS